MAQVLGQVRVHVALAAAFEIILSISLLSSSRHVYHARLCKKYVILNHSHDFSVTHDFKLMVGNYNSWWRRDAPAVQWSRTIC